MDNYRTIATRLESHDNFTGNSLTARRRDTSAGCQYEVFSYNTLIASYNLATGESWVNPNSYSMTTTRGLNLVKRAWGLN